MRAAHPVAALVGAVVVFAAPLAHSASAVVIVFEAKAHVEPDEQSHVAHLFPEGAEVSVSEDVVDGWRRIRLPGGMAGWVREQDIQLKSPSPTVLRNRSTPAPAPSRRTGAIYVKDLDHFVELVASDPYVHREAATLERDDTIADVARWGGLAAGAGLMFAGLIPDDATGETDQTLLIAGLGVMGVGALVGWIVRPTRNDLIDVINMWNTRHPEEPFTFTR